QIAIGKSGHVSDRTFSGPKLGGCYRVLRSFGQTERCLRGTESDLGIAEFGDDRISGEDVVARREIKCRGLSRRTNLRAVRSNRDRDRCLLLRAGASSKQNKRERRGEKPPTALHLETLYCMLRGRPLMEAYLSATGTLAA